MNRQERANLYDTIEKWLKSSTFDEREQWAIKSLLTSLRQCENSKASYEYHIQRMEKELKDE